MIVRSLSGFLVLGLAAVALGQGAADDPGLARLHVVGGEAGVSLACGGIPVPRWLDVHAPEELRVVRRVDGGGGPELVAVDAAWRVLARWGGPADDLSRPVRWVLAELSVPEGAELWLVQADRAGPTTRVAGEARARGPHLVADAAWVSAAGVGAPLVAPGADLGGEIDTAAAWRVDRLREAALEASDLGPDAVLGLSRAFLATRDGRFLAAAERAGRSPREGGGAAVRGLLLLHAITGRAAWRELAGEHLESLDDPVARLDALVAWFEAEGDPEALSGLVTLQRELLAREETARVDRAAARDVARLGALVAHHRLTGDARSLASLLRGARRLLETGFADTGTVVGDAYAPLRLSGDDGSAGIVLADALAYAARATGERWFLERSRDVYRDAALYLGAPSGEALRADEALDGASLRGAALNGAPWLRAALQTMAARGDGLAPKDSPRLAARIAALREAARRAATREAPPEGPAAEPAAVPDGPGFPSALVVDDSEAVFEGSWVQRAEPRAEGGAQSVAVTGGRAPRAVFDVDVPGGGPVRISARWWPIREAWGDARVRVASAVGVFELGLDLPRDAGRWRLLGEFEAPRDGPLRLTVEGLGEHGAIAIDGLRVEPVR